MAKRIPCPRCSSLMADHAKLCITCARSSASASAIGARARALGISAAELSRRAGCSTSLAEKAMRGLRVGSYAHARRISIVLAVPIEAVANGQEYYEQAIKKAAQANTEADPSETGRA